MKAPVSPSTRWRAGGLGREAAQPLSKGPGPADGKESCRPQFPLKRFAVVEVVGSCLREVSLGLRLDAFEFACVENTIELAPNTSEEIETIGGALEEGPQPSEAFHGIVLETSGWLKYMTKASDQVHERMIDTKSADSTLAKCLPPPFTNLTSVIALFGEIFKFSWADALKGAARSRTKRGAIKRRMEWVPWVTLKGELYYPLSGRVIPAVSADAVLLKILSRYYYLANLTQALRFVIKNSLDPASAGDQQAKFDVDTGGGTDGCRMCVRGEAKHTHTHPRGFNFEARLCRNRLTTWVYPGEVSKGWWDYFPRTEYPNIEEKKLRFDTFMFWRTKDQLIRDNRPVEPQIPPTPLMTVPPMTSGPKAGLNVDAPVFVPRGYKSDVNTQKGP